MDTQIILFRFPQTDLRQEKLRPALLLGKLPGEHDDWLICMISSQLRHAVADFNEIIQENDADFSATGLKTSSVIRIGRIAVVEGRILLGAIGQITPERLDKIRRGWSNWFLSACQT